MKISEGCIKNCAFCIIPKIRGTLRSRSIESLVVEAKKMVADGAVELNLIAQDLTDYGRDLRDGSNLLALLKELVKIEGLQWIRMLYVYPDELTNEFIEFMANEPKICKYVDMPIQHIADRMLHLMNRKVTGALIRDRIQALKNAMPDITLRTNVIVGYPGETEEEFEELKAFVREAQFDYMGVFSYSHEEGTASYLLPKQLKDEVKLARKEELLALQQEVSAENLKKRKGRTVRVLVEEISEESEFLWRGRYEGQAPDVDGHVLIRAGHIERGKFAKVKLERSMEYDYIGSAV